MGCQRPCLKNKPRQTQTKENELEKEHDCSKDLSKAANEGSRTEEAPALSPTTPPSGRARGPVAPLCQVTKAGMVPCP